MPSYGSITIGLSIHVFMDIWIVLTITNKGVKKKFNKGEGMWAEK